MPREMQKGTVNWVYVIGTETIEGKNLSTFLPFVLCVHERQLPYKGRNANKMIEKILDGFHCCPFSNLIRLSY